MFDRMDRKSRMVVAYLVMGLFGALGLAKVSDVARDTTQAVKESNEAAAVSDRAIAEAERAIAEVERASVENAIKICEANNADRRVVLDLIEEVSSGGGSTDFTSVPGYKDLDLSVQRFLANLGAPEDDGGNSRLLETARRLLVDQDCKRIIGGT